MISSTHACLRICRPDEARSAVHDTCSGHQTGRFFVGKLSKNRLETGIGDTSMVVSVPADMLTTKSANRTSDLESQFRFVTCPPHLCFQRRSAKTCQSLRVSQDTPWCSLASVN